MKKRIRGLMPETAAFIDAVREAFGAEEINCNLQAAMRGEPLFFASEGGHEIGTKSEPPAFSVTGNDLLPYRHTARTTRGRANG
jgi:hypothetical protein